MADFFAQQTSLIEKTYVCYCKNNSPRNVSSNLPNKTGKLFALEFQ